MCELLGMSSRHPANLRMSFEELMRHGGGTAHHADGWGLGMVRGRRVQLLVETQPAASSDLARFLLTHQTRSPLAIAHVRKATQGAISLANTQPFVRVLGGRDHLFAHNGDLHGLGPAPELPVGETDSELGFLHLLARLAPLWSVGVPSVEARCEVVRAFAAQVAPLGIANFLYTDGELLFAHAHKRTQADGSVAPPGLWLRTRRCPAGYHEESGGGVRIASGHEEEQAVALFASVPLSDEAWSPLAEGTLVVVRGGEELGRWGP